MKFFFVKFFLTLIGIIFLITFILSSSILLKNIYFSDTNLIDHLFNKYELCDESNKNLDKDFCSKLVMSYWMITISITSLVFSFITLFPLFMIKKKIRK